jgi:glycerate kinase
VRVLIAPDCFTGTLTAQQAAEAIAAGWRRAAGRDDLQLCPLSDGGPGFVPVLHAALGGRLLTCRVPGPLGEPVTATALLVPGPDGVPTGYLESAQACGLHLVPPDRRDPGLTTTAGVGVLLAELAGAGARRIVVGLGGSATNDAGAGLLAALAADDLPEPVRGRLRGGGAGLRGITAADLTGLAGVRDRWSAVDLVLASDVDVPLLGLQGASAGFARQKGATAEQAQDLERALGDFAAAALQELDGDRRTTSRPGAGAAGGLGFGLMLLGAARVPGSDAVLDAVGFTDLVRGCDLVITGEGSFDWQSLRGKVIAGVARRGLEAGTPVVVVAGQVEVGRREALAAGVESAYPVARTPAELRAALADPAGTLAARAERVARTWSPNLGSVP